MSVVVGIILSLVFAIALYKLTIMKSFFKGLTLIPYLISGIAAATMFKFLFAGDVGMVNQFLSVFGMEEVLWLADEWLALFVIILANIWFVTPFAILILLAGLQGIDEQIFEAAKIDGASKLRIVFQIIIPLISSMIGVSLIWLSFASFNMFDIILPLTGGGPGRSTEVLAVYLYKLAFNDLNYSMASAVMIVIMTLNLAVSFVYLKVFKV
nr:sugar ABC transporter permease [Aquibacillus halophilus]